MSRRLVLSVLLGCLAVGPTWLAGPAQAQAPVREAWTVDTLLAGFSAMPGLEADFREEKQMALLAAPLVNEGTIHFAKGKLARHTTAPVRSSVLIADGLLEFGDESGKESIDLAANPVVRLFVDSFVHIFSGDRAALEQLYSVQFNPGQSGTWTLVLRPRMSPMDKVIDRIILDGTDLVIGKMRIIEIGGDETTTVFSGVDTKRKYSVVEMKRIFAI